MDSPTAGAILSSVASLLVIVGALLGATVLARRLRATPLGLKLNPQSPIQIITTRPLGNQNTLAIIETNGQQFLIGISRAGIASIGRVGGGE